MIKVESFENRDNEILNSSSLLSTISDSEQCAVDLVGLFGAFVTFSSTNAADRSYCTVEFILRNVSIVVRVEAGEECTNLVIVEGDLHAAEAVTELLERHFPVMINVETAEKGANIFIDRTVLVRPICNLFHYLI